MIVSPAGQTSNLVTIKVRYLEYVTYHTPPFERAFNRHHIQNYRCINYHPRPVPMIAGAGCSEFISLQKYNKIIGWLNIVRVATK